MEPADFEAIALKIDGRLAKSRKHHARTNRMRSMLIPALQKNDRVSAVMAVVR